MPENIIPKPINDEMIDAYMLYSMSVIVGRAKTCSEENPIWNVSPWA